MPASDLVSTPFTDAVFTINIPSVKFGLGATADAGYEAQRLGIRRALVVVDPHLEQSDVARRVLESLEAEGVTAEVVSHVRIEPEDTAVMEAWHAIEGRTIDGFVSVGGGSTIDTAKMLNLLYSYPADLHQYINRPLGQGQSPPGPLKPHVAVPTTAGTGSESTAVAILDLATAKVKSGISHRSLRPDVAIIDPLNTLTLPPMVTASSGLDVLNHAIESFTTHPYTARPPVAHPRDRAVYAGATPVADLFALESIRWVHRYLRRAFAQPRDIEARYYMMLGASIAGIGFGHAGVHIPHAMGYPLAGMVRQWHPDDYDFGYPISPHGISTAIPAAYVLPFLVRFQPARFEVVAQALGLKGGSLKTLSDELMAYYLDLLDTFGVPTRLAEMGFTTDDLDRLVEGTWAQQRLLTLAPKMVTKEELRRLWEMMIVGA